MDIRQLREALANFPADAEVCFELDPNGTGHIISMLPQYMTSGGGSEPEKATKVTMYEQPPEEEVKREFIDQVRIGLPEEFLELCYRDNVKPEVVLHGFIADLCGLMNFIANPRVDGLSSNGSDERSMAEAYYDRCGYSWRFNESIFTPQNGDKT